MGQALILQFGGRPQGDGSALSSGTNSVSKVSFHNWRCAPFIAAATDPCPLKRSGVARAHGATLVGVAFTGVELVAFSGSAAAALPRPLRVVGMIESAFLRVCGRARG